MTRNIMFVVKLVLATICVVSCSSDEATGKGSMGSQNPAKKIAMAGNESCAAALVPYAGADGKSGSKTDRDITRYQQALSTGQQTQQLLERLGWAFVAKARESRDMGYYQLAEQVAICIDSVESDAPAALLLRGHVLHNLHRFNDAEKLARQLVEQRGAWFDYALLGDVLTEQGELNEAVDAYQAVADQRPGPQAYARIAQIRWLKGDQDGALELMSAAIRSTSARTPESLAWMHVRLARMLMHVNELTAADAIVSRALDIQAGYPPALHLRGRLLLAHNRTAEAVPLLEQAVQADPLPEYRWTLYEALSAAGHSDAATRQKSDLMRYGETEDRRTFSLFLATQGDEPQTALRLALNELKLRKDVYTLDAVAWALSGAGMNKEAVEFSRRAMKEGTRDARLFLHAGVIAARAGHRSQAVKLLNEAMSVRQMLLPSERRQLSEEFVALQPRAHILVNGELSHQERFVL